jgi:hypothetical protein
MYRTEYTPKEVLPCPAALLEYVFDFISFSLLIHVDKFRTPRSDFVLHHTEATGHKFYHSQQEAAQAQQQPVAV